MNRAGQPGSEPADHALGRSRGGLSTKIHQLVDGKGRPLVIAVTAGQAGDSPMLRWLLVDLVVRRAGPGRPRTRPEALLGDKAYSSRAIRALLRGKRVRTVIPQPADQITHRQRRRRIPPSSRGFSPPAIDKKQARVPTRPHWLACTFEGTLDGFGLAHERSPPHSIN